MDSNFNQLGIKLTEHVWIEVFAEQHYVENPFKYLMKGGLSYPGRALTAGLDVSQPEAGHGKAHQAEAYFQWAEGGRAEARLNIAQGNSAFIDYVFTTTVNISGYEPICLGGKLARIDDKTSASVEWNFGQKNYTAMIEYLPGENRTSDKILMGTLEMDQFKYKGNIQLKNTDNEKSILIDLDANQHVYLLVQAKNSFNDIKVDFFWDKDRDANKRILLETSLHQDNLLAHMKLYEYEGKINGSYTADSVDATVKWGAKTADIVAKCVLSWHNIEVLLGLKTTNPLFKHIKTHVQLLISPLPDGSNSLNSKVIFEISQCTVLMTPSSPG
jgi:hypothetical protein